MTATSTYLQLLVVVALNGFAQVSLKIGSEALASISTLLGNPLSVLNHPYFLIGAVLYAISFGIYVNALSQARLSIVYPFIGLTYVFVVFLSAVLLDESVGFSTVMGALLVFIGVSLIGASNAPG